jgi:cellulose synthase/poly-beta-1,6-N-acetylglucosamine synthase-like glycosyltransferase
MINLDILLFLSVEAILLYALIFYLSLYLNGIQTKKKLTSKPKVSILIPAYNEEKTIHRCISSVLNLNYPKEKLEIIVINDGSTDRTKEIAESFGNKIKLINQKNQGKSKAMNKGLKVSTGEFVACLDADSYVEKNALRKMLLYFNSKIAAVTPLLKVDKPKNLLQKIQFIEYIFYIFVKKCMAKINTIFVTPGPFTIYRKNIIKALGGFDEKSIVEDQEIAYRLQKNHYRIEQSGDGEVFTEVPKTLKEFYRQRSRWSRGTILTLLEYKKLIFNPKYGDFGLFQLPLNFFGLIVPFIIVYFLFKVFFIPIYDSIMTFIVTDFSINFTYPNIVNFFLSTNFSMIYFNIIYLVLFLFALIKAFQFSNEKIKKEDILSGFFFVVFFYILTSFIILCSLFELLTKRRKKW